MNKRLFILVVATVTATLALADLSTDWRNSSKGIYDVGGAGSAGPFVVGGVVQLIWSPTGITTTTGNSYAVDASAIRGQITGIASEYVLLRDITTTYGKFTGSTDVFTSADIGGADINTGFFFTRIFQGDGSGGQFFLDTDAVDASLWVYDDGAGNSPPVPDTATIYKENAIANTVWIDANNTTVIPEPGTFGLMGLAGLGLFMARRSALKKARRI